MPNCPNLKSDISPLVIYTNFYIYMQQLKNWLLSHFHAGGGWSYLLCPSRSACLRLCFPWISERVLFPSCLRWLPCQSYSLPLDFAEASSLQQAKESRGQADLVHPDTVGRQVGKPLAKFESEIQDSINISSAGLALSMSTSPFTTHIKN